MGFFKSSVIYYNASNYTDLLATELQQVFRYEDYEVSGIKLPSGEWDISIRKGNLFKAVLGLQTALKIKITPTSPHICISTDVGIFGQQAIPTLLTVCVWWPIAISQIWGIVKQRKLDNLVYHRALNILTKLTGRFVTMKILN